MNLTGRSEYTLPIGLNNDTVKIIFSTYATVNVLIT